MFTSVREEYVNDTISLYHHRYMPSVFDDLFPE